jgi:predicted peroxiredoxin
MNWVISGTWGPTDPTRAMLPFVFAASAVQAGDTVTLMLFPRCRADGSRRRRQNAGAVRPAEPL